MTPAHTAQDEQDAIALLNTIETALLAVLEQHTRALDAQGEPRYARWAAIHAVMDLGSRLMLSAIAEHPEDAAPRCRAIVDHLDLLLTTRTGPVQ